MTINDIECKFDSLERSIRNVTALKLDEYSQLEKKIYHQLTESTLQTRLNEQRNVLIDQLTRQRQQNLHECRLSRLEFKQSADNAESSSSSVSSLADVFPRFLTYKRHFSLIQKLSYLHVLIPRKYHDIELFDIKYPTSTIRYSLLLNVDRLFLFILLDANSFSYVMQTHDINKSSFKTMKQHFKNSVHTFAFQYNQTHLYALFNKSYIEMYDFELTLVKRVDLPLNEYLFYKRFLVNKREIIIDNRTYLSVYDCALSGDGQKLGQSTDPNEPFYIESSLGVVNVTKDFLIFYSNIKHFIKLMARSSGLVVDIMYMDDLCIQKGIQNYFSFSFFIDYDSSDLYFKQNQTNTIYSIDLTQSRKKLKIVQNRFQSNEFLFDVLVKANRQQLESYVLIYKLSHFSPILKIVYMF